ncbi:peptidoglycan DD-metalloendopeptidase family protein [Alkalicaulis satelles]|uniref:Peptidoglycan DD-metalloendopeptidase family protein n=1 Tax=Alkalicaulis satelles TaxID=2609175 RepID=A0A5M6ZIK5_9PROT|nr:peptidoglycan DD-metalloendopeptidase family protein [Alkalicaulis satelles]KAA5803604.1 peptidoglycan DD-metalloendopeptidase family protein [Alkalicaulis satelles]
MPAALITALMLALSLAMAQSAPDPERAEELESQAEALREEAEARRLDAEAASAEIALLQRRLAAAGDEVRARETEASRAVSELEALEAERAELRERLAADRAGLAQVLAALQRIALADPPALAVTPDDAAEAARAASLLAALAPQLEARARAVRERLAEIEALELRLTAQADAVADAREALSETRAEVEALIARRRDAERRLRAEADDLSSRAARIAREAGSLRELLAEIRRFAAAEPRLAPRFDPPAPPEADGPPVPRLAPGREDPPEEALGALLAEAQQAVRPSASGGLVDARPLTGPPETLRLADARGALRPPVNGRLAVRSGQPGPDGVRRDGVWFEAAPRAAVTAPFDGMTVYAGPFQGFDGVVMINTPDGYTIVLGGLALIYASEGQSLLTGEPVGLMSDRANPAPMLYLEIRRSSDDATDPEPWLRPEYRRG